MPKELIMRGRTDSGSTEKLNFGGQPRRGYGYRMTQFQLYPSSGIGVDVGELVASITADKVAVTPTDPNFNDDGLIATSFVRVESQYATEKPQVLTVINDLFVITQDLILMVQDTSASASPVNWQVRFEEIKLSDGAAAVANFHQFTIFDD